jgi:hypothetical protein
MQRFDVVDINLEDRSMTLRSARARMHVARATAEMPEIGDVLEGLPPALGSALLVQGSGQVVRVVFDLVDVSQDDAMERLHASLTP